MADTVREIERKYEADNDTQLPDLAGIGPVAAVAEAGTEDLDALYYDTTGLSLAADGITLRRRTGGRDAGWHLKLPVAPGVRDEVRAPLSDVPPPELTALVRSRALDQELVPVVRLRTRRMVRVLRDAAGTPLAEVAEDAVHAWPAAGAVGAGESGAGRAGARWREIEVELLGEGDTGLLDEIGRALAAAGVRPASAASKLARALAETGQGRDGAAAPHTAGPDGRRADGSGKAAAKAKSRAKSKGKGKAAGAGKKGQTAGDVVLRYAHEQVRAIIELEPAVRRDLPDSVHQMRVATRRLRSAFRSYTKVLDRAVTRPIGVELKWLAAELGVERDREVLTGRLQEALAGVPGTLRLGPVDARLRIWSERRRAGARDQLLAVLDGPRHLSLLKSLHAFLEEPPLRKAAGRPAPEVVAGAVLKDYRRLARRTEAALAAPAGRERDEALHGARKAAKRTRYAAEAARPALGRPAKKFAKRTKRVQQLLGDHQDSVVARATLRELATQAQRAGEGGFTFGLLYGREEALAADRERALPDLWRKVSRRKHRAALRP
ncbi:CYTH and CHAD domain-containing protein [Streptomyces nigrescens]|uniref:CHAD domain-containing protein n=1 Tax=Streptomyces nigrescens TaxID=1920 RepID=A0A640TLB7_STRNI|nr:CYTH and CHAD domain-containing protein [Streptomyces libani]WAT99025.1 CYTH and CHAD domain-containing protein [Streptomyces libani subsp. libani]GFE24713.1 CHAD domain-containing protein [Streptomyces libani subsp. libani]GGV95099.1 CHAD domain-containing protein [Streptomyces libani subsp. libani]